MTPEQLRNLQLLDALSKGFSRMADRSMALAAPWTSKAIGPQQDLMKAALERQKMVQQQRQQGAQASLMGGYDPNTGIKWKQGRGLPSGIARDAETGAVSLLDNDAFASLLGPALQQRNADLVQAFPTQVGAALTKSIFTPAKPPTTKEFKVGDEIVTRQWNPVTQKFEDIYTAPRFEGGAGTLTTAQRRTNEEIDQARRTLEKQGLSKEDVKKASQKMSDTGLENRAYNSAVAGLVRMATRRKYGTDPDHAEIYSRYYGKDPAAPAGIPSVSGGGGEEGLGAAGLPGAGMAPEIPLEDIAVMSRDELETLVEKFADEPPPEVLSAIVRRLEQLGL